MLDIKFPFCVLYAVITRVLIQIIILATHFADRYVSYIHTTCQSRTSYFTISSSAIIIASFVILLNSFSFPTITDFSAFSFFAMILFPFKTGRVRGSCGRIRKLKRREPPMPSCLSTGVYHLRSGL
jgi:hypothetical protein